MPRGRTNSTKIAFLTQTSVSDGQGGVTETWATGAVVWAEIEYPTGYRFDVERQESGRMASMPVVTFIVEDSPQTRGIATGQLLKDLDRGVAYTINAIVPGDSVGRKLRFTTTQAGAI